MLTNAVVERVGTWFLNSGIQELSGGVARYYRADAREYLHISTEITGYTAAALLYLHGLTGRSEYLERARRAAAFLTRAAWDPRGRVFPFECNGNRPLAYFFDTGIIARGLLSLWRATGENEYLEVAAACGQSMARDFRAGAFEYHPVLALPAKQPLAREPRWSRSPGCYQLKAALAWREVAEAIGDAALGSHYEGLLEPALGDAAGFLPGHASGEAVMDRLHAYCYFLEALLPRAAEPACAAALRDGILRVAGYLREIGPSFERSDVCAQLLRVRCFAAWAGAAGMDAPAACSEADRLAGFQAAHADPRLDGGFYFARRGGQWVAHLNPVSAAFALQALSLWEKYQAGAPAADWRVLI